VLTASVNSAIVDASSSGDKPNCGRKSTVVRGRAPTSPFSLAMRPIKPVGLTGAAGTPLLSFSDSTYRLRVIPGANRRVIAHMGVALRRRSRWGI
jgi:hypothetical protein